MGKQYLNRMLAGVFALGMAGPFAHAGGSCRIAGPENAPLTIEEFADFHCRFCAKGWKALKQVVRNYPDGVRLVFRNLPLPDHNPGATAAAKAFSAVCLQSPALAYLYQAKLFENQDKLIQGGEWFLYEAANQIGVDLTRMKSDMESEAVAKMIFEDRQAADSRGISGTPTFVIGSETVVGARPYPELKQIIDRQLGTP